MQPTAVARLVKHIKVALLNVVERMSLQSSANLNRNVARVLQLYVAFVSHTLADSAI